MKPFTYERATSPAAAAAAAARSQGAKFIAGGTNLLDLMKLQIETPIRRGPSWIGRGTRFAATYLFHVAKLTPNSFAASRAV